MTQATAHISLHPSPHLVYLVATKKPPIPPWNTTVVYHTMMIPNSTHSGLRFAFCSDNLHYINVIAPHHLPTRCPFRNRFVFNLSVNLTPAPPPLNQDELNPSAANLPTVFLHQTRSSPSTSSPHPLHLLYPQSQSTYSAVSVYTPADPTNIPTHKQSLL